MDWTAYKDALMRRLKMFAKTERPQAAGPGYQITSEGTEAEILLYDEIGFWGIRAGQFVRDLAGVSAEHLKVRINSPGGDVFDGVAIYNALKAYKGQVTVTVDGLAASIASIIAMAGQTIVMRQGSFLMLHHPWALVIGNAGDMRQMAGTLDKIGGSLIEIYATRSKQTPEDVRALMDAVTWLSADEAIAKGFADKKTDQAAVAAAWDLGVYGAVPPSLPMPADASRPPVPEATPEPDRARMGRRLKLAVSV